MNTQHHASLPELPEEARLLRIHVTGDFDTVTYIEAWIRLLHQHPWVSAWGYTRSWRIPELLPILEELRKLPNIQLFASMDSSIEELPPIGWRRAWLEGDERPLLGCGPGAEQGLQFWLAEQGLQFWLGEGFRTFKAFDGKPVYVCPEETGHKPNCQECGYCWQGKRGDVLFLMH